jgi:squalene-hopene/tetraprenyl-beta-curcumene cyclase
MDRHGSGKRSAILAIALLASTTSATAGEATQWKPEQAARYLDGRAGEWEAFRGADRGEGADKVSCLSCHTSVSYALGRPAVRRAAGEAAPSPHETRLLEQVKRRVAHWSELDTPRFRLSYDFDERKKVESWGTEAVLNALVLAGDDRRSGRATPSDSTRQALRHLWAAQRKDGPEAGSWDWLDFGLRPWEFGEARFYGTTLAAIAVGTAPGYLKATDAEDSRNGVEPMRRFIGSKVGEQSLHNRLFALWASTKIDGLLTDEQREQIIAQVVGKQQEGGGWSLSSLVDGRRQDGTPQEKAPDGYATGLAVHVLRLAGVGRDRPAVARGLAWLRANQQPSGGWVGFSLNKRRDPKTHVGKFMSDAATALAVLALEDR